MAERAGPIAALACLAHVVGADAELVADLPQVLLFYVKGEKRALEAAEDDLLDVGQSEPELGVAQPELAAHGGVRNQPVVGVDGDPQAQIFVELQGVAREIANGARLHVRRRATLERNAVVVDVVEQITVLA